MPKYLVLVRAANFPYRVESNVAQHGAFTTRVVKAADETAASEMAYASVEQRIRTDDDFAGDHDSEIRLTTVVIKEVSPLRKVRGYALVLYEEGDLEAETEAQAIAEEAAGVSTAGGNG